MAQKNKDAAGNPQPQVIADPLDSLLGVSDDARESVEQAVGRRKTLMEMVFAAVNADADATVSKAESVGLQADAAISLYLAAIDGQMTLAEVKALLGDIVGYEPKKDGTPGASLAKGTIGRPIEQRVSRAFKVRQHLDGKAVYPFAAGRDADSLALCIRQMEAGEKSIWAAYKEMGDLKETVTINAAFDPKRVAKIAEALKADGALAMFQGNEELKGAYRELIGALKGLSERAAAATD